jgi:hypothetical protein
MGSFFSSRLSTRMKKLWDDEAEKKLFDLYHTALRLKKDQVQSLGF